MTNKSSYAIVNRFSLGVYMFKIFKGLLLAGLLSLSAVVSAQTATGSANARCSQVGQTITCTTTTLFVVPNNISIQPTSSNTQFVLGTGSTAPIALAGCVINPPSGQLAAGSLPNFTIFCAQGGAPTTYSWFVNGAPVSTASNYSLPSNSIVPGANFNISATLSNGILPNAIASATYSVPVPVSTCYTFGNPARTINFADPYVALNNLEIGSIGATYILGFKVAASDSTAGKLYLPVWAGANSPVTQIAQKTVAVSLCPNDFNPSSAQILASGSADFSVSFTTEANRVSPGVALVQPGRTYYINVRNDTCRAEMCTLDGQYRNWNQ